MGYYTEKDECLSTATKGQELMFGWFSTHMYRDYNWVVGFANNENNMVYVPENSKLIGPDGVEYEVKLERGIKPSSMSSEKRSKAYLHGIEKKFGLDVEVTIPLENVIMLRFEKTTDPFKVKEIGQEEVQLEREKRRGPFSKLLERFCEGVIYGG